MNGPIKFVKSKMWAIVSGLLFAYNVSSEWDAAKAGRYSPFLTWVSAWFARVGVRSGPWVQRGQTVIDKTTPKAGAAADRAIAQGTSGTMVLVLVAVVAIIVGAVLSKSFGPGPKRSSNPKGMRR